MRSLYDIAFEDALAGFEPVVEGLDHNERALYMAGFVEGQAARNVLEPS